MTNEEGASRFKFKVLPLPEALPVACIACGVSTKPVVDFGVSIDYYGAVYICVDCVKEMAHMFGFVPRKEFENVVDELEVVKANLKDAENAVTDAVKDINERANLLHTDLHTIFNVPVQRGASTVEQIAGKAPESSNSGPGSVGQDDKTTSVEGSSGVSDDSGDESGKPFGFS